MGGAIASWVPSEILVGALTVLLGLVYTHLREQNKERKTKEVELERAIAHLAADTQGKFDRMGERFDARQQSLMQDVAVLKAMQERGR